VQDNAVISGIAVVTVCLPVCRTNMDFDVLLRYYPVDIDDCVKKIRAGFIAGTARVENTHPLVVDGFQNALAIVDPFPQLDNPGLRYFIRHIYLRMIHYNVWKQ
jgi:hypothetical protein